MEHTRGCLGKSWTLGGMKKSAMIPYMVLCAKLPTQSNREVETCWSRLQRQNISSSLDSHLDALARLCKQREAQDYICWHPAGRHRFKHDCGTRNNNEWSETMAFVLPLSARMKQTKGRKEQLKGSTDMSIVFMLTYSFFRVINF